MDAAYTKSGIEKELVFPEDYIDSKTVNTHDFICPYEVCRIPLSLASYKSTDKRAAHFKRFPGKPHHSDCPELSNYKKGKKTNGIDNSLPVTHKSVLQFNSYSGDSRQKHGLTGRKGQGGDLHNNIARTLSSIVRWFLQNPYDGYKELSVPGCGYSQYRDVFQKISVDPNLMYAGVRVYFGFLKLKDGLIECDDRLTFKIWQDKSSPVSVFIDKKNLTKAAIHHIKNRFDYAKKKSEESSDSNLYIWLFFLGAPVLDGGDEFEFKRSEACSMMLVDKVKLGTRDYFYNPPSIKPISSRAVNSVPDETKTESAHASNSNVVQKTPAENPLSLPELYTGDFQTKKSNSLFSKLKNFFKN